MKDRVLGVSIEVQSDGASSTLVIRDPLGENRRVYVAGALSIERAEEIIQSLGLCTTSAVALAGGTRNALSRVDSSPTSLSSVDVAIVSSGTPRPERMAESLDELVASVLRVGRTGLTSTVDEAIESARLLAEGRAPLLRLVAGLEDSLEPEATAQMTAFYLTALDHMAKRLRDATDPLLHEGFPPAVAAPVDASQFIEIARRRERGAVAWETRLLVDLVDGTPYREEGPPGSARLSRGPVGRHLTVTLGKKLSGLVPVRLEIQHYEYDPAPQENQLRHLAELALRDFEIREDEALELAAAPRPVFLNAGLLEEGKAELFLSGRTSIPLGDGDCPGAIETLRDLIREGFELLALGGAIRLQAARLAFEPWAVIATAPESNDLHRTVRLVQLTL